jgi:hypothetical protein
LDELHREEIGLDDVRPGIVAEAEAASAAA